MANTTTNPEQEKDKKSWMDFELVRNPLLRPEYSNRPYQDFGVFRSISSPSHILGFPTGTGKTLASYDIFLRWKAKVDVKAIYLVEKSTLHQFANEFDKFFLNPLDIKDRVNIFVNHASTPMTEYRRIGFNGNSKLEARTYAWDLYKSPDNRINLMITTHGTFFRDKESVKKSIESLRKKHGWRSLFIVDEAGCLSSSKKQPTAIKSACFRSDLAVGLTASISRGKLEHAYHVCDNLGIRLARTKKEFEDLYCVTERDYASKNKFTKKVVGYKNIDLFTQELSKHATIFSKSDLSSFLPELVTQVHLIEPSKQQLQCMSDIYANSFEYKERYVESDEGSDYEEDTLTQLKKSAAYLDQALLGVPAFIRHFSSSQPIPSNSRLLQEQSPKAAKLIELMNTDFDGEKVIIYVRYKSAIRYISNVCRSEHMDSFYRTPLVITGDVNNREEIRQKFSTSPNHNVLIINDAAIKGLNLQAASNIIALSMPKSSGDLIQLIGRISRIDAKAEMMRLVYLLIEDSYDSDNYELKQVQLSLLNQAVGEAEKGLIDKDFIKSERYSELIGRVHKKGEDEESSIRSMMISGALDRKNQYRLSRSMISVEKLCDTEYKASQLSFPDELLHPAYR